MRTIRTLALAAGIAAAPASAVTWDAFTTFTGTQGAGNFVHGTAVGQDELALFSNNTNCAIPTTLCLQSDTGDFLGVYKSTAGAFEFGSLNVPGDALLAQPGAFTGTVVAFVAPAAGRYRFGSTFAVADDAPSGTLLLLYQKQAGLPADIMLLTLLDAANPAYGFALRLRLDAGELLGFIFLNGGEVVANDAVGFNFAIASFVPEPSSWALLIAGFGLLGTNLRRRRAVAA